MEFQTMMCL